MYQSNFETIYNIDDRTIEGHINDVSEDLRDYLRRRGIKIYTDRFLNQYEIFKFKESTMFITTP